MEVKDLGHVVFFVRDLARSVHFYRDVLGFKPVGRVDRGARAEAAAIDIDAPTGQTPG